MTTYDVCVFVLCNLCIMYVMFNCSLSSVSSSVYLVPTCLRSNMSVPTMTMQRMLRQVRVRLIMPRQNSSRGMSPYSAYSNLKSCTRSWLRSQ